MARRSFFISREGQVGTMPTGEPFGSDSTSDDLFFFNRGRTIHPDWSRMRAFWQEEAARWGGTEGPTQKQCKSLCDRLTEEGRVFFLVVPSGAVRKFNEIRLKESDVIRKMARILSRHVDTRNKVNEESYQVLESIAMEDDDDDSYLGRVRVG